MDRFALDNFSFIDRGDPTLCEDVLLRNQEVFAPNYPPRRDPNGDDRVVAVVRWNGEASENFSARRSPAKVLIQCAFQELLVPTSP